MPALNWEKSNQWRYGRKRDFWSSLSLREKIDGAGRVNLVCDTCHDRQDGVRDIKIARAWLARHEDHLTHVYEPRRKPTTT